LHLGVVLTFFRLMRRLGGDAVVCASGALLFAVHPLHVEAIANVVGRAELLAALFSFLGLMALSHSGAWGEGPRPGTSHARHRLAAWIAALLLFMALGAKEVAVGTILLYVGMELLFRPRGSGGAGFWISRAAALAPSALAALLYLGCRVHALESLLALQQPHPMDNPLVTLEGAARTATALGLATRYVFLLLYPVGLSADYSGPAISVEAGHLAPLPLLGLLLLTGCLVAIVRPLWCGPRNAGARRWSFAALLFLAPYLIIGNLFFDLGTIFAERVIYLSSSGFCFMFGLLFGGIAARSARPAPGRAPAFSGKLVLLAQATLVAGFMVMSWARCHDWRNDETLFAASSRARPSSPRSHFIVGKMAADRQDNTEALERFETAIALYPDYAAAWGEKGVAHGRREEYALAEQAFGEALRINPSYSDAHLNLAIALRRQGRAGEAERSLRRAALWDPASPKTWAELGNLYLEHRRFRAAAEAYRRAIALGRADLEPRLREAEQRAASSL
jgi:hypothetical protein